MPLTTAQKVAVGLFSRPYAAKLQNIFGSSIVSYLPLWDASGSVATDIGGRGLNGAYTAVTLGQTGIGDGRTAASFDGSTSFVNWYSAGLASAFNASEGTLMVWGKVSAAGVWSDTTVRYLSFFRVDGNNQVGLNKSATANRLTAVYAAGGTANLINITTSPTAFFHFGITWSKAADQVIVYLNGAQQGATLTGLGTWVGALPSTGVTVGSQQTTPSNVWSGTLAHAVLLNRAATAAEFAAATVP